MDERGLNYDAPRDHVARGGGVREEYSSKFRARDSSPGSKDVSQKDDSRIRSRPTGDDRENWAKEVQAEPGLRFQYEDRSPEGSFSNRYAGRGAHREEEYEKNMASSGSRSFENSGRDNARYRRDQSPTEVTQVVRRFEEVKSSARPEETRDIRRIGGVDSGADSGASLGYFNTANDKKLSRIGNRSPDVEEFLYGSSVDSARLESVMPERREKIMERRPVEIPPSRRIHIPEGASRRDLNVEEYVDEKQRMSKVSDVKSSEGREGPGVDRYILERQKETEIDERFQVRDRFASMQEGRERSPVERRLSPRMPEREEPLLGRGQGRNMEERQRTEIAENYGGSRVQNRTPDQEPSESRNGRRFELQRFPGEERRIVDARDVGRSDDGRQRSAFVEGERVITESLYYSRGHSSASQLRPKDPEADPEITERPKYREVSDHLRGDNVDRVPSHRRPDEHGRRRDSRSPIRFVRRSRSPSPRKSPPGSTWRRSGSRERERRDRRRDRDRYYEGRSERRYSRDRSPSMEDGRPRRPSSREPEGGPGDPSNFAYSYQYYYYYYFYYLSRGIHIEPPKMQTSKLGSLEHSSDDARIKAWLEVIKALDRTKNQSTTARSTNPYATPPPMTTPPPLIPNFPAPPPGIYGVRPPQYPTAWPPPPYAASPPVSYSVPPPPLASAYTIPGYYSSYPRYPPSGGLMSSTGYPTSMASSFGWGSKAVSLPQTGYPPPSGLHPGFPHPPPLISIQAKSSSSATRTSLREVAREKVLVKSDETTASLPIEETAGTEKKSAEKSTEKSESQTSSDVKAEEKASDLVKIGEKTSGSVETDEKASDSVKTDEKTSDSVKTDEKTSGSVKTEEKPLKTKSSSSDGKPADASEFYKSACPSYNMGACYNPYCRLLHICRRRICLGASHSSLQCPHDPLKEDLNATGARPPAALVCRLFNVGSCVDPKCGLFHVCTLCRRPGHNIRMCAKIPGEKEEEKKVAKEGVEIAAATGDVDQEADLKSSDFVNGKEVSGSKVTEQPVVSVTPEAEILKDLRSGEASSSDSAESKDTCQEKTSSFVDSRSFLEGGTCAVSDNEKPSEGSEPPFGEVGSGATQTISGKLSPSDVKAEVNVADDITTNILAETDPKVAITSDSEVVPLSADESKKRQLESDFTSGDTGSGEKASKLAKLGSV